MGDLEILGRFQAKATGAVDADMGQPQPANGDQHRGAGHHSKHRKDHASTIKMQQIIERRPNPRPGSIAQHRQIRRQQDQRPGPPGPARLHRKGDAQTGQRHHRTLDLLPADSDHSAALMRAGFSIGPR